MQYVHGIEAYSCGERTAITLGKFDGLHRGHQKLINQVAELKRLSGARSVVCAFDMLFLYRGLDKGQKILMTDKERKLKLQDRVDCLVNCPFTEKLSHIEAEDFIKDILAGVFHAAFVVVGSDFGFGYGKRGTIDMLAAYQDQYDYRLIVIEKEKYEDREISSTYVKEALREGDVKLVHELLGYPYTISGTVRQGKKLGRTLGFPTLNVYPASEKLMPPNGVYMNRVWLEGNWYPAICNIGVRPTVSEENRLSAESFLFNYSGNAYGKDIQMELYEFVRPERKFSGVQEMKRCVDEDISFGRRFFKL